MEIVVGYLFCCHGSLIFDANEEEKKREKHFLLSVVTIVYLGTNITSMIAEIILGIVKSISFIVSTSLLLVIYKYLKGKPPGLQTVLDLLIIDCLRILLFNNVFSWLLISLGFYGHVNFICSQIIMFIANNSFCFLVAMFQGTIIVKAVLIFRGHWIGDMEDYVAIWLTRIFASMYATIRFLVDLVPPARPKIVTKLLTGTSEPS